MREGRPLEELEPATALACDGAGRDRTALAEGDGLPPSSEAPRSTQASTEDRDEDADGLEEQGGVTSREPWRISTKKGLDSCLVRGEC